MTIGAIGIHGPGAALDGPRRLTEAVPQVSREFEAALSELRQKLDHPETALSPAGASPKPPAGGPDLQEARVREEIRQPGGAERVLSQLEQGQERLSALVADVQSGRTYSTRELLSVQTEIQQISRELEVASKVVAEATTGIKTLLQQQV
jgi:hypothetical protein